jgi:hypothetical protein
MYDFIMLRDDITWTEKILLAVIESFSNNPEDLREGSTVSLRDLAAACGMAHVRSMRRNLEQMEEKGLIEVYRTQVHGRWTNVYILLCYIEKARQTQ